MKETIYKHTMTCLCSNGEKQKEVKNYEYYDDICIPFFDSNAIELKKKYKDVIVKSRSIVDIYNQ